MSIASPDQLQALQTEYTLAAPSSRTTCYVAAAASWLVVAHCLQERNVPLTASNSPEIWSMGIHEEGLDSSHAYFVVDGVVYSCGVTTNDSRYPEYDYRSLKFNGREVTGILLRQLLNAYRLRGDQRAILLAFAYGETIDRLNAIGLCRAVAEPVLHLGMDIAVQKGWIRDHILQTF